jgi:hypothetical protein
MISEKENEMMNKEIKKFVQYSTGIKHQLRQSDLASIYAKNL